MSAYLPRIWVQCKKWHLFDMKARLFADHKSKEGWKGEQAEGSGFTPAYGAGAKRGSEKQSLRNASKRHCLTTPVKANKQYLTWVQKAQCFKREKIRQEEALGKRLVDSAESRIQCCQKLEAYCGECDTVKNCRGMNSIFLYLKLTLLGFAA